MANNNVGARTTYLFLVLGINFCRKRYIPKKAMFRETNSFKTAATGALNKTYIFASREKSLIPRALNGIFPSTPKRVAE